MTAWLPSPWRGPPHRAGPGWSGPGPVRRSAAAAVPGRTGRADRAVLAAAGPGRPGRGRGVVRLGRHRAEDRFRSGLPAAGHLALAAPGHHHHAAGRRRGLRGVRAAGLAGPRPRGQRADAPVRQVVSDLLVRARHGRAGRLPPDGPGRDGTGAVGRSPPSCPACRSWSWAWGPRWPTCCAPTPGRGCSRTAGPDHQPPCGPCPGPPRTRPDQTAGDRRRTGPVPEPGPTWRRAGPTAWPWLTAPGSRTARAQVDQARLIARRLAAAGKPVSRRALRNGGVRAPTRR